MFESLHKGMESMNCKKCGNKFSMIEVPVEERIYGPFSAMFKCPNCQCWLQAGKKFKVLSMIGASLVAVSTISGLLNSMHLADIDKSIIFTGIGAGIAMFTASLINIQTDIVE
ncbi:MAG: hypothetical protein ACI86X_002210 [Moritella sp.]|jgi:hypothetical protein